MIATRNATITLYRLYREWVTVTPATRNDIATNAKKENARRKRHDDIASQIARDALRVETRRHDTRRKRTHTRRAQRDCDDIA